MNHLPVQPCFKHSQLHLRIWECHYLNRHFLVQLGVMHPAQGHLESMYERFPQWGCNQKQLVCVVRPRWRGEKRSQLFRVKSLPSQRRGTHNNHLNITYRQIFLEATCIVAQVPKKEHLREVWNCLTFSPPQTWETTVWSGRACSESCRMQPPPIPT